jgi:hypothetical protein
VLLEGYLVSLINRWLVGRVFGFVNKLLVGSGFFKRGKKKKKKKKEPVVLVIGENKNQNDLMQG